MDTSNLKRQGLTWYARFDIPRPLRKTLGKSEILRTLKTRDLREANKRKHVVLATIQREVALAGRNRPVPSMADAGYLAWFAQETAKHSLAGTLGTTPADEQFDIEADRVRDHLATIHGVDAEGYPNVPEEFTQAIRRAPRFLDPNVVLLSKAIEDYLAEAAPRVTASTSGKLKLHLTSFSDWLKVDCEVTEVTRKVAGKYVADKLMTMQRSLRTRKEHLVTLVGFWKWAIRRGTTAENPWTDMRKDLKESTRGGLKTDRRAYELPEAKRVLTEILQPGSALLPMACIAAYTGMRIEEIAAMRVEHVTEDTMRVVAGKTDAAVRTIPLHPVIRPMVAALVASTTTDYLIPGLVAAGTDQKLSMYPSKQYGMLLRQHGFPAGLTFHSWRNTAITGLEQAGVPISTIQLITGHKRAGVTFGTYSKGVDMAARQQAMAKLTYGPELDAAVTKLASVVAVTQRVSRRTARKRA
jgi:integrase